MKTYTKTFLSEVSKRNLINVEIAETKDAIYMVAEMPSIDKVVAKATVRSSGLFDASIELVDTNLEVTKDTISCLSEMLSFAEAKFILIDENFELKM